ncbi:hypothetical protein [Sinomonas terrae]|uniref:LGFP repeat-containing protein n=1 Tax=Sinomonas terrae TaxID=2908838 RepID=A0ABS9U4S1_9MICC|nr:hypothetical protein [Sinomonas terrae]MCH6471689.1 hypothetical protein [Sinomonas terrae]
MAKRVDRANRSRKAVVSALGAVFLAAAPTTSAIASPGAEPAAVQPALSYPQRTAQISVTLVTVKTTDHPTATYDTTALQNSFQSANSYWQTISAGHISLVQAGSVQSTSINYASTADFSTIMNAVASNLKWTDGPDKVLMMMIPGANISVSGVSGALGVTWETGTPGSEGGRVLVAQQSSFTGPVMTHELGHIQGLGHSNILQCTDGAMDSQIVGSAFADSACSSREYGDNNSIMGISQYSWPYLDSVLFQFGGFGNGNEVQDAGTAGTARTYTLTPWAGTGASRALEFTDPATGEIYNLQYKAPIGYDAPTATGGNQGIQILKTDIDPTESLLIPPSTQPYSGYYSYNLSWQPGQTFTTDGGTQVTVNSVSSSSATVTVTAMAAIIGPQMDAKAAQWGLGSATGAITPIRNGGYYRNYQGGAVIWTPANGAMVSHGAIRSRWSALGFENGPLGYPTTDEVSGLRNGGVYQNYEGGAIIWSPATGAHSSMGVIRQRWQQLGFEGGELGYPTSETVTGLRNGGSYQNFENGAIISSPTAGTHESVGAMRTRWSQLGFEGGILGYPTTNVVTGLTNGGSYQNYEGGAIISSPTAGTHESYGSIRQEWQQLGFETGKLGYPTSNIVGGLINGGSYQNYENGAIISSPTAGTHESYGPIRQEWSTTGFETGVLGYPTTEVVSGLVNGGTYQNYQGGAIVWSQATGAHESYGPTRQAWQSTGFESGKLGYPTSEVYAITTGTTTTGTTTTGTEQDFQGGKIVYSNGTATITYKS